MVDAPSPGPPGWGRAAGSSGRLTAAPGGHRDDEAPAWAGPGRALLQALFTFAGRGRPALLQTHALGSKARRQRVLADSPIAGK